MSATLADAFATDPIFRWFPSQRRSDRRRWRLFALELGHYVSSAGQVFTTDDFRGASVELPPGK